MFINRNNPKDIPNSHILSYPINPYILAVILSFINKFSHTSAPIHIARHTFATLQIASGTDIYTVSKLLTHSSVSTTQVYAEVVNELKRDASKKISLKS